MITIDNATIPANAVEQTLWVFGIEDNIYTNSPSSFAFTQINTPQNQLKFPVKAGKKYLIEISSNYMSQSTTSEYDISAKLSDGQLTTEMSGPNTTSTVNSGLPIQAIYIYAAIDNDCYTDSWRHKW